jgi:hypothetical protein
VKSHTIGQAAARRQIGSRIDERRAQVDSCRLAPKSCGETTRRPADSETNIQHARRWIEASGMSQFGGGENAPRVELVERSELSDRLRLTFGVIVASAALLRSVRPVTL